MLTNRWQHRRCRRPFGFSLSRLAEVPHMNAPIHSVSDAFQAPPQRWLVPGGVHTVMALAWLSFDKPARAVANAWRALATETKRRTTIEDLCGGADITVMEFFRSVYRTGLELNALFRKPRDLPIFMLGLLKRDASDPDVSLAI